MHVLLNNQEIEEKSLPPEAIGRALWWGDGVFTTLKVVDGIPLDLDLHLEKVQKEALALDIECQLFSKEALQSYLQKFFPKGEFRLKILVIPEEESFSPLWSGTRKGAWVVKAFPFPQRQRKGR